MHVRIANTTIPAFRRVSSGFQRRSPWMQLSCRIDSNRNRRFITTQTSIEKPYYITTPIFYVNAAPHVGHLYTMVLTDVIKRWHVLKGEDAILCTGTDEHGLKVVPPHIHRCHSLILLQVQRAAAKAGVDPKLFCDQGAEIFKVRMHAKRAPPSILTPPRNLHKKRKSQMIISYERPTVNTGVL